jgi:hypothetical protein
MPFVDPKHIRQISEPSNAYAWMQDFAHTVHMLYTTGASITERRQRCRSFLRLHIALIESEAVFLEPHLLHGTEEDIAIISERLVVLMLLSATCHRLAYNWAFRDLTTRPLYVHPDTLRFFTTIHPALNLPVTLQDFSQNESPL